MVNAWRDLAEAVSFLSEFFRPGQTLEDNDIIYFLNSATDYIYLLEQKVEHWKFEAQR